MSLGRHVSAIAKAALHNATLRMAVWIGLCLSAIFVTWIVVANRMPALEGFAMQRNVAAEAALGFFALLPVVRFMRRPRHLLFCGGVAWSILSLTYWAMGLHFVGLAERWSTFEIFTKGCLGYLIAATLAWVGTCAWRVKHLTAPSLPAHLTQPLQQSHIPHSNHHTS